MIKSSNITILQTCFVLREPFGIVFVEAMSYGLPIVANNIGSIPDLIENGFNGYLINNNITDYTNAICTLFDNPLQAKKMGENGLHLVKKKLQWELVGELITKIIDTTHKRQEYADS